MKKSEHRGGVSIVSDVKIRFSSHVTYTWASSKYGRRYRRPIQVKIQGSQTNIFGGLKSQENRNFKLETVESESLGGLGKAYFYVHDRGLSKKNFEIDMAMDEEE